MERKKAPETDKSGMHLQQAQNGSVERLIDAKKMLAIVGKNWLVLKGDMARLVPLFMFPLIMIVIFGYTSGNMPKQIPAGIADYDQSGFSNLVLEQLSDGELYSFRYRVGTQDEGKRLMDEGKIKALFILPQGLEKKVESGQEAKISLMVDESDSSVAQIAKSSADALARGISAQVEGRRLEKIALQAKAASGKLAGAAAALSADGGADAEKASSDAYYKDAKATAAKGAELMGSAAGELRNSLGYLVDQNEAVESFSPASMGRATLVLLAVGDQQQATLQQIAIYQAMLAYNSRLAADAAKLYASGAAIASQQEAGKANAKVAVEMVKKADADLGGIGSNARNARNGVSVELLEPYGYGRKGIDFLLPNILALVIFQGATMGLGRAVAGERKDGSMTRVFLTPTSNVTIILGTQLFYLLLETVRSSMMIFAAIALFGVTISGSIADIIAVVALFAVGATGVGMVLSVITSNQEQYMAVGMLISLPMMFLSGVFFPIQTMPPFLQGLASYLPITYASDAMRGVMVKGFALHQLLPDIAALLSFGAFTFALSALLFKREVM